MGDILDSYQMMLMSGELRPDPEQQAAAEALDRLAMALGSPLPKPGLIGRLLGHKPPEPPRGIYLWGKVGRGKSMLMDLFFEQVGLPERRRVHFHAFMLEVHERLNVYRKSPEHGDDPIPPTAGDQARLTQLLCLDEMQLSDIADATIVGRLFTALIGEGVTVVITSNREPEALYLNGLNREHVLPFIALLRQKLDVIGLNGPTDYRLDRMGGMPVYYTPNGPEASARLSEAFFRLTDFNVEDRARVPSATLWVQGRQLFVPKSLKGVAVFSFRRLCDQPLGAADYLAIARRYHTVIVVGIPVMGPDMRNQAKRFVTLIDALYEYKVKLLCAADAVPDQLYPAGDGSFEFERTVSRLMEMQSAEYLALGHGG